MNFWESYFSNLFRHAGFTDFRVEVTDEAHRTGVIFLYDSLFEAKPDILSSFVDTINSLVQIIAKKQGISPIFFDVNNYRHARHVLIADLAKAAARRVAASHTPVSLPPMNSFERRIVHTELAAHPTVTTQSVGEGRERHIVISAVE